MIRRILIGLFFTFCMVIGTARADCVLSAPCPPLTNGASVTVAAATASDQNMMQLTEVPGMLNFSGRVAILNASGTTTTGASANGALTIKLKLCTVSGCGSGTVLTLLTMGPTATEQTSLTAGGWVCDAHIFTVATGSSGTLQAAGKCAAEILSATPTDIASTYVAVVAAVSNTIDLTKQLFWQWTIAAAGNSSNNSNTQYYADRIVVGP